MPNVPQEVIWLVSIILIEAAIIDGLKLKVPNGLTFHLVLGGLAFSTWHAGFPGLISSLEGAVIGLALLIPLYAIGGMGAGDVKLLAGIGAWIGPMPTVGAFVTSAMVGAVIAVVMVVRSGNIARHWAMFQTILDEIVKIRDPGKLSEIAAARKPTMMLLPYGIPIAIGSIGYFAWSGMLF